MFQIIQERNNIHRLEFLIHQTALVRSLAKIIHGAMVYDDDRIIRFNAGSIRTLGENMLTYEESLQFVWCIATQIKHMITFHRSCFYTFRLENIWRIGDKFVYIDDVMEIDDADNIVITHFINKDDPLLSPELRLMERVPFRVHYKTIYYSFGKLLQTISDFPLDVTSCLSEDPEKRIIAFPYG